MSMSGAQMASAGVGSKQGWNHTGPARACWAGSRAPVLGGANSPVSGLACGPLVWPGLCRSWTGSPRGRCTWRQALRASLEQSGLQLRSLGDARGLDTQRCLSGLRKQASLPWRPHAAAQPSGSLGLPWAQLEEQVVSAGSRPPAQPGPAPGFPSSTEAPPPAPPRLPGAELEKAVARHTQGGADQPGQGASTGAG